MLTFEGQQFQGSEAIIGKLKTVGKVSHQVKSMDVQPSVGGNALVIFVTGHVSIGEGGNPLHFCEMFQLVSTGPNVSYDCVLHCCRFVVAILILKGVCFTNDGERLTMFTTMYSGSITVYKRELLLEC